MSDKSSNILPRPSTRPEGIQGQNHQMVVWVEAAISSGANHGRRDEELARERSVRRRASLTS